MTKPPSITVDIKMARKLEKAGWDKRCFSYWVPYLKGYALAYDFEENALPDENYCAPTASEILDGLPIVLRKKNLCCSKSVPDIRGNPFWQVSYDWEAVFGSDTLANAAAELWIYLKENDLLPSEA